METVETNVNGNEPKDSCCLPFTVFCAVTTGLILTIITSVNVFGDLCHIVSGTRDYCETFKDQNNNTVESTEVVTYRVYCFLIAASTVAHLIAFFLACSLMYLCSKICCVPVCGCIYRCLFSAGHTWYILIAIGGFFNLAGSIALLIVVPVDDVFDIYGYRVALGSIGFDIVTVATWIVYKKCYGAPDQNYFLGSSKKVADYQINVTKTRTDTTYKYTSGRTETREGIPMNNYSLQRRY